MDLKLPERHGRTPSRRRNAAIAAIAVAAIVLLGACSSSRPRAAISGAPSATAAPGAVTVHVFMFNPSPVTVNAGTTVTWTNQDEIMHTVTSGAPGAPTGVFDGTMDGVGRQFSFRFDRAGTFPYFCSRHNGMRGEVIVEG